MIGFVGVLLGMFAIGVMQLILATALPFIVSDIGGAGLYSWVFSSYMLASLAVIPLFSKLADIYGKRRLYFLGLLIFAIGSLYGGFSPGMNHLIAARVIQGFGAGIITPVTLAIISDMFPGERRGKMIGIFGFVQLLSNLLSPPLGSFITKQLGWHWIFFITLSLIALVMILVSMGGYKDEKTAQTVSTEIDIIGGLAFGGFCVFAVSLCNFISKQGKWGTGGVMLLLAVIVSGITMVVNESRHRSPIIKVEFLKNKVLRRSIISSIVAGAIMYGLITILPLCGIILNRQGFEVDESKILLLFMIGITTGLLTGSSLAGSLKAKHFTKALWMVLSVSSLLLLYSIAKSHFLMFNILNILIGLCTGGIMATFLINSQNAIGREDRTILSGLIQLGRYFGASIGVTILTGLIPEVDKINFINQFQAAFLLLTVLCVTGLINEII